MGREVCLVGETNRRETPSRVTSGERPNRLALWARFLGWRSLVRRSLGRRLGVTLLLLLRSFGLAIQRRMDIIIFLFRSGRRREFHQRARFSWRHFLRFLLGFLLLKGTIFLRLLGSAGRRSVRNVFVRVHVGTRSGRILTRRLIVLADRGFRSVVRSRGRYAASCV